MPLKNSAEQSVFKIFIIKFYLSFTTKYRTRIKGEFLIISTTCLLKSWYGLNQKATQRYYKNFAAINNILNLVCLFLTLICLLKDCLGFLD